LRAGLLGVGLVGIGAFLFDEPDPGWILLASLYPVTHVLELSATIYKNRISWRVPVAMRAAASTLSLAFVVALLAGGAVRPALYLCAVAAGSTLANVGLHVAARRHLPPIMPGERPIAKGIFAAALPLGLSGLCAQTYFYVDNLFVRAIEGPEAVGVYNIGVRILGFSIMVALFASMAALPWFTREHAEQRLGEAIARLAQPLFALAGLGAGVLFPWCEELLGLFGPDFVAGGPSLRWLLSAVCVIYLGAALMTAVVSTGRTRSMLTITSSGLLLNLVGNALLVPRLGIEGAAIATLATEAAVVIGATLALARLGVRPFGGRRAALWLGGPLAFAAGAWLSSLLPLA
jgi:O-antigen/teichoic acid export membrane protein